MNKHITVGEMNRLLIDRVAEPGIFLKALDEECVLLPNKFISADMQIGEEIEVFIHTDSEDRLVATTQTPYAIKGDFVLLQIVDVSAFGAFLDMGLDKDLLIPKRSLKDRAAVGKYVVVKVDVDEKSNRLIATQKFKFEQPAKGLKKNDEVEILVFAKTPLGFKVVVDNSYEGMLFHNEIFTKIEVGKKTKAYIKQVRADGKVDLSLQKIGSGAKDDSTQIILDKLSENGGEMNFTYKSDPEDIKNSFGISKKNFKSALTKLIENGEISLKSDKIALN